MYVSWSSSSPSVLVGLPSCQANRRAMKYLIKVRTFHVSSLRCQREALSDHLTGVDTTESVRSLIRLLYGICPKTTTIGVSKRCSVCTYRGRILEDTQTAPLRVAFQTYRYLVSTRNLLTIESRRSKGWTSSVFTPLTMELLLKFLTLLVCLVSYASTRPGHALKIRFFLQDRGDLFCRGQARSIIVLTTLAITTSLLQTAWRSRGRSEGWCCWGRGRDSGTNLDTQLSWQSSRGLRENCVWRKG